MSGFNILKFVLLEMNNDFEYCSDKYLADLYLKYGSTEEALKANPELPVSIADFHRKIKKLGIVKGHGRTKVSIAEVLHFFSQKVMDPKSSIESLYRSMPYSVRASASIATMHRVYEAVCSSITRSYATALIINGNYPREILVADELLENKATGKFRGLTSLPMGFSIKDESYRDSILRVLQREVSTKLTIEGRLTSDGDLTKKIIPDDIKPFMFLHLLDIEIAVFNVELPQEVLNNLRNYSSSYKVSNHRFVNIHGEFDFSNFRLGIREIIDGYQKYRFGLNKNIPFVKNALINEDLAFTS